MSLRSGIKYKRYSEELKRQVVEEYHRGGMSYLQLREKHGIGCTSTIKSWVENVGNGSIVSKKHGNRNMINQAKYDELLAENKQLKRKVAEDYLLQDVLKWQRESIADLFGKKALAAIEKNTKKKLL